MLRLACRPLATASSSNENQGHGTPPILASIQLTAGFSLIAGGAFGRIIGIIGGALAALEALLEVGGIYPFWSLGVIALCMWILQRLMIYAEDEESA